MFRKTFRLFHNVHYDDLMTRLEKNLFPVSRTDVLEEMLPLLVNEEHASFLSKMPNGPIPFDDLLGHFKNEYKHEEIEEMIEELCQKGMLFDVEFNGKRTIQFPEMVVGFLEHFWMKDRKGEMPTKEIAKLWDVYLRDTMDGVLFEGGCDALQLLRTVVHEDLIEDRYEVLDYESAIRIIENGGKLGVGHCTCRQIHNEINPENPSKIPTECCLALGDELVDMMVSHGVVREITTEEGLEILQQCRDLGLVQNVDNSRAPNYMCNCEKDTCYLLSANQGKFFDNERDYTTMVTSNFVSYVDYEKCIGCMDCVKKCPMYCFSKNGKNSLLDDSFCIGCGVCARFCKEGAITMIPRDKRHFTPQDQFDKILRMAIERKRLHLFVFPDNSIQVRKQEWFKKLENSKIGEYFLNKEFVKNKLVNYVRKWITGTSRPLREM